jgi:hypothetical protein
MGADHRIKAARKITKGVHEMEMQKALKIGKTATTRILNNLAESDFARDSGANAMRNLAQYKRDIAVDIARAIVGEEEYRKWYEAQGRLK